MAPRLVFVHGIGGPRDPAAELAAWSAALAGGMRVAGHSALAAPLEADPAAHAAFVSYADLFNPAQAQGADDTPAEAELLAALVAELVDEAVESAEEDGAGPEELAVLANARAEAMPTGQQQGAPDLARRALNAVTTLLSLRPWDGAGQWLTPKLMVRHLGQVARYLARAEADGDGTTLDARIRARVAEAVGDGPVVVAHSLGTVVALEALHERRAEVPLFVTLGSPIAMRSVVLPRLRPQPPAVPDGTARWLNFWDRDDVIAVRPRLERDLAPGATGVRPVSARIDSDGLWVHTATKYLAQAAVAGPIAEALSPARG